MIHVEHLRKLFGDVRAVDGISFEVARGEVVGLLGPNGAGKTTTMRVLTGYLRSDEGTVSVDGIPVGDDSVEARRRIGYLPENAPIYDDMEVCEYLGYVGRLRGMRGAKLREAIAEMVQTCGLAEVAGRTTGKLSKGFRQRAGLAAAMIHRPPILILDEPTSGLDPNQISEIRELIRNIGKQRTVVLSTHIRQEVEATCQRAIIINSGKLVGHGTVEELKRRSQSKSAYVVTVGAARDRISDALKALGGVSFGEWLCDDTSPRQRLSLTSEDGADRAEEIFKWAVEQGLTLTELSRTGASLEQVFKELTQNR